LNVVPVWYAEGDHHAIDVVLDAILEPEIADDPAPAQRLPEISSNPTLCIDFGTSTSLAATYSARQGLLLIHFGVSGTPHLPTVVTFRGHLNCTVGREPASPDEIGFRCFKREIGSDQIYRVGPRAFSADDLSVLVIRYMRRAAEQALGRPADRAIAAAPANFSTTQRNRLAAIFARAGLRLLRLVAEPCAAALNTAEQTANGGDGDRNCLVVDLGGGTLDVSVVETGDNVVQVKSVAGDNRLGGTDFDQVIADRIRELVDKRVKGWPAHDARHAERIAIEAERAKIALSRSATAEIVLADLDDGTGDLITVETRITQREFLLGAKALSDRVEACLHSAIAASGVSADDIREVLLAGQGARVRPVTEVVRRLLQKSKINDTYQDRAVVRGLAIQAGVFDGHLRDLVLLDITYRGLAASCHGFTTQRAQTRIEVSDTVGPKLCTILDYNRTIPTQATVELSIRKASDQVVVPLLEFGFMGLSTSAVVTSLILDGVEGQHTLHLTVDVDALGHRTVWLRSADRLWSRKLLIDWTAEAGADELRAMADGSPWRVTVPPIPHRG
jgi:molecular chaperone DnaK